MKTGDGAESTAKMAHVDEVDLLVRRRNELVLEVTNARAVGKRLAERLGQDVEEVSKRLKRDAKEEAERLKRWAKAEGETMVREAEERAVLVFAQNLSTVCAELQAENEERFGGMRLPPEMWQKILDENVQQKDLFALAVTCRFFRDTSDVVGLARAKRLSGTLEGPTHMLQETIRFAWPRPRSSLALKRMSASTVPRPNGLVAWTAIMSSSKVSSRTQLKMHMVSVGALSVRATLTFDAVDDSIKSFSHSSSLLAMPHSHPPSPCLPALDFREWAVSKRTDFRSWSCWEKERKDRFERNPRWGL